MPHNLTTLASCAVAVPDLVADGGAQWVQIFPMGKSMGRDGRGPYIVADLAHAERVVKASLGYAGNADIPVDYDHQVLHGAVNGQKVLAAGWIKTMEARPNGIWASVEWTSGATKHLGDREYRYLSPLFAHDKQGRVTRIHNAGLTNLPNLDMVAVASQDPAFPHQGDPMDFMAKIRDALGLPGDATEDTVLAAASSAVGATKALATLAEGLKMKDGADAEAIVAAAQQATTTTGKVEVNPAEYVPMGQFNDVSKALADLQGRAARDDADKMVAAAQVQGKVTPAMAGWAKSYAVKDPDGFTAWASSAPVMVRPGAIVSGGEPATTGTVDAQDPDLLAVASQLGLDAKAMVATAGKGVGE
ncbi:MAG: phage protease [Rhodospirillum sp.]|nr:phage protease [Rhodospirillum sp.]MCF8500190.1 phage protease [Rhodospirillum sp.]